MKYKFTAAASDGKKIRGIVEAVDSYEAVSKLRDDGLIVKRLIPIRRISEILTMDITPKPLTFGELSTLCMQFAVLLRSGISLVDCVTLLMKQIEHKKLKRILGDAKSMMVAGNLLADSLYQADRSAFPVTFLENVRAGERSGSLARAFESLGAYYERRNKIKQKVSAAMLYPGIVCLTALIVIGIVMIVVVPSMATTFVELEAELPLPTRILIGAAGFVGHYWINLLMLFLVFLLLFLLWIRTGRGQLFYDGWKLNVPILGRIHLLAASGQFANTMAVMLHAGVNLTQALDMTAKTLENAKLASAVVQMAGHVVEGGSLGACMREEACFPENLIEVCAIGEQTGELEKMLRMMGGYYDSELEFACGKALTVLEPVLLILLAVFAAFVVISLYLPMFQMYRLM